MRNAEEASRQARAAAEAQAALAFRDQKIKDLEARALSDATQVGLGHTPETPLSCVPRLTRIIDCLFPDCIPRRCPSALLRPCCPHVPSAALGVAAAAG